VEVGVYLGHRRSLPGGDFGAGTPGPDDVFRVAQFDERMIAAEVAECLRVYGGADGTVQVFGCGKQVLCLEHAVAVADPPPVRAAGQAQAATDFQILRVLEDVPDARDGRRLAWLASDNGRPAVRPLNCSSAPGRTFLGSATAAASSATVWRRCRLTTKRSTSMRRWIRLERGSLRMAGPGSVIRLCCIWHASQQVSASSRIISARWVTPVSRQSLISRLNVTMRSSIDAQPS
jgi:hypothetical protein